jgi:hypothetical protein
MRCRCCTVHTYIRKLSLQIERGALVRQMARGKELGSCEFQFRQQQADPRAQTQDQSPGAE